MNAFDDEPEELVRDELRAVERVLRSGWWILGREVAEFEAAWAARTGTTNAVGVANGMEAIELVLLALGIGPGDEVITTPMTAFATVLAVLRVGADPVLADIDLSTAMLEPASVERCISARTRAVLLVHLYGQAGPVKELKAICDANGLFLLEDCAQAHGASVDGQHVGTFGTAAAWSFFPTKNLGAVGDAGAVTTSSDPLAHRLRTLRNYGQEQRYVHTELGLNSRLDELQAAILLARLDRLDDWTNKRRRTASTYSVGLNSPFVEALPPPVAPESHVHHHFVVRSAHRDDLQRHLAAHHVESLLHYPLPIHRQPSVSLRFDPQGLANAEHHAAACLSLPIHPQLQDDEIDQVVAAVNEFEPSDST